MGPTCLLNCLNERLSSYFHDLLPFVLTKHYCPTFYAFAYFRNPSVIKAQEQQYEVERVLELEIRMLDQQRTIWLVMCGDAMATSKAPPPPGHEASRDIRVS